MIDRDNVMNAKMHITLLHIVNMTAPSINQTLSAHPRTWTHSIFSQFEDSRNYAEEDMRLILRALALLIRMQLYERPYWMNEAQNLMKELDYEAQEHP